MPDSVGLVTVILFSAALFSIGLYGAMSRKAAVMILMSLEIMIFAIAINIVAFSQFVPAAQLAGWNFALFVMVVGAAEVAIGLSLIVAIYRKFKTSEVEDLNELKG